MSASLSSRADRLACARLYLIATVTPSNQRVVRDAIERALGSGALDLMQLRAKGLDESALHTEAVHWQARCAIHAVLFVINDSPGLAHAVDADGVHVGDDDASLAEARQIIGADRLVGVSTHDAEEVRAAHAGGADYVGLGPCFPTRTKHLTRPPGGADLIRLAATDAPLPVFPIGGIDAKGLVALVAAGARRAAVGAAVLHADDPAAAARELAAQLRDRDAGPNSACRTFDPRFP